MTLQDGRLVFDAGEVRSEMRPRLDEAGQVVARLDGPAVGRAGAGMFDQSDDGRPEVVAEVPGQEGPTTYVFTFVGPNPSGQLQRRSGIARAKISHSWPASRPAGPGGLAGVSGCTNGFWSIGTAYYEHAAVATQD